VAFADLTDPEAVRAAMRQDDVTDQTPVQRIGPSVTSEGGDSPTYKIIYPNGKIYVGKDLTDTLNYFRERGP